jgi:hypothetical protein
VSLGSDRMCACHLGSAKEKRQNDRSRASVFEKGQELYPTASIIILASLKSGKIFICAKRKKLIDWSFANYEDRASNLSKRHQREPFARTPLHVEIESSFVPHADPRDPLWTCAFFIARMKRLTRCDKAR